jgi:hypothetical protein
MRDLKIVLVLAAVAVILAVGIGILIVINPVAGIGLGPVLAAIAVIIRAIGGTGRTGRRR